MPNLTGLVDIAFMRNGFYKDLESPSRGIHEFYRGPAMVSVIPNSHGRTERGEPSYSGSHLSIVLEGRVREDVRVADYHASLKQRQRELNKAALLKNIKGQVQLTYAGLNGGNELRVPRILLEYASGTAEDQIADSLVLVEEEILRLLSRNIEI